MAADPNATATNLVGLPPWQAQKLYVHLYPTNRLFHEYWETPFAGADQPDGAPGATIGLTCHVSQGPSRWIVASVYNPSGPHSAWPSEWWGLYASTVGPDTVLSNNAVVMGYPVLGGAPGGVPASVAAENFLEHLVTVNLNHPPVFTTNLLTLPPAAKDHAYTGQTLAPYAFDWDYLAWPASEVLTFTKTSGPAWLSVGADGTLSGTPSPSDAGTNTWVVRVTDSGGLFAETTLTVFVVAKPPGQEDLMGWWKLDETAPGVLANSEPLAPDGASYGGMTLGQAGARPWTGNSVLFNGIDAKADVPYCAELNSPTFTAALWANATGGGGTLRSPLGNQNVGELAGYGFYASSNDCWQFWAGDGSNWIVLPGGPVVTNTWIHLAATCDGTTACFYTNGVLAASANGMVQTNDTFPLRIGAGGTDGRGQYWFPGFVDDVQIYRRALDAARVASLFANTAAGLTSFNNLPDGSMVLEGVVLTNQTCVLLATTTLKPPIVWTPIATNVAGADGCFRLTDPGATNCPRRFYHIAPP